MYHYTQKSKRGNLYSAFVETAELNAERIFVSDGICQLSYLDALSEVNSISAFMKIQYMAGKGSKVGILISNRVEFVVTVLAINKLGASFVPINKMAKEQDINDIVSSIGIELLIYEEKFEAVVLKTLNCITAGIKELFGSGTDIINDNAKFDNTSTYQDVACIFLTSGTTGKPKGVMLGNDTFFSSSRVISVGSGYKEGMSQLVVSPLYHIFPFHNQIAPGILLGHTIHLLNYESVGQIMQVMDKNAIEIILAAPLIYSLMLMSGLCGIYKLLNAKIFGYSGAPMNENIIVSLQKVYPHVKMVNSYGATEAGGTFAVLPPEEALKRPQSVGVPGEGVDIKVIDEENRFVVNKMGEILVKNSYMKGYINGNEKSKFFGGYLRTGDVGLIDCEGYVYINGRVDDMMIVNGTNIYPADVEKYFSDYNLIGGIVVLARKSIFGDQIVAFVESVHEKEEIYKKLVDFAENNIPEYKRPIDYIFIEKIPRSAAGKILRKELEDLL